MNKLITIGHAAQILGYTSRSSIEHRINKGELDIYLVSPNTKFVQRLLYASQINKLKSQASK